MPTYTMGMKITCTATAAVNDTKPMSRLWCRVVASPRILGLAQNDTKQNNPAPPTIAIFNTVIKSIL